MLLNGLVTQMDFQIQPMPEAFNNRTFFNEKYPARNLDLNYTYSYDHEFVNMRLGYIKKYGQGKTGLDLCCGTGKYLQPGLQWADSIHGMDFSKPFLQEIKVSLQPSELNKVKLLLGDAQTLPLRTSTFDFIYSYTSLYYLKNIQQTFLEIHRILKDQGVAILELGNKHSLNQLVSMTQHRRQGWARPYHISTSQMKRFLKSARLDIIEWRAFQLSPMYGAPRELFLLTPILTSRWKKLLGKKINGKMIDEWISSFPIIKPFASRHMIVVQKNDKQSNAEPKEQ